MAICTTEITIVATILVCETGHGDGEDGFLKVDCQAMGIDSTRPGQPVFRSSIPSGGTPAAACSLSDARRHATMLWGMTKKQTPRKGVLTSS